MLRQMVQRVLILTPPGLVEQRREELATEFKINTFVTNNDEAFRNLGADAWLRFPWVIASLATARRGSTHTDHRRALRPGDRGRGASSQESCVGHMEAGQRPAETVHPAVDRHTGPEQPRRAVQPGDGAQTRPVEEPQGFQRDFVVHGDPRLPKNRGLLRDLLSDVMVRHSSQPFQ